VVAWPARTATVTANSQSKVDAAFLIRGFFSSCCEVRVGEVQFERSPQDTQIGAERMTDFVHLEILVPDLPVKGEWLAFVDAEHAALRDADACSGQSSLGRAFGHGRNGWSA
jgi:hypothetical protein